MGDEDAEARRHQLYLDSHRTSVEPIEKRAAALEQARMSLALVGFRASYTLNAGAALALPAFAEILSINDGDVVLTAVGFFVAGIVCTIVANFTGYYGAEVQSVSFMEQANARAYEASQTYSGTDHQADIQKSNEKYEKLFKISAILSVLSAILLAAASVCFVLGVLIAAGVFDSKTTP